MRSVLVALLLGLFGVAGARAEPFGAAVVRLVVPDLPTFNAFVWYPTASPPQVWAAGPFPVHATPGAPIVPGQRFPIVLVSHGGGPDGGNPLLHRDLAAALARNGFIVVMPIHGNTAQRLITRPRQAREALDAMLADPRFAAAADPAALGMVGYSLGGAVTLIVAGAKPNVALFAAYCRDHPDDAGACANVPRTDAPPPSAPDRARLPAVRAIVLMDPLAALFDRDGLEAVRMPVLLYRPEHPDVLRADGNALRLAASLPVPPDQRVVPGGHGVFADPCPPELQSDPVCRDAPGVDRVAVHRALVTQIVDFFRETL